MENADPVTPATAPIKSVDAKERQRLAKMPRRYIPSMGRSGAFKEWIAALRQWNKP